MSKEQVMSKIDETVKTNPIVIYMKGTPDFPRCGFSGRAAEILKSTGRPFAAVDVLEEEGVWDGIQEYSGWPTFPQIFIGGKLVGGCDIVTEMHQNGDLQRLIAELPQSV